jgi:N-acetylglucosaminyldiphosphoundecaprenol N-acetyl-beta-D-mannosaminyltransferase
VVRILGVPVHQLDMGSAVRTIDGWIRSGKSRYVCVRDVHGVMRAQSDAEFRRIHEHAGLVTPDGMPLVWVSRLRGSRAIGRVCGPDLVDALCDASQAWGAPHFFFGGKPGVAEEMAQRLKANYPKLIVAGTFCPPFRDLTDSEDRKIVDEITRSGARIVWIGISTPRQEEWMRDHVDALPGCTLIGVGAAFDFHAGTVKRAPRWMQRNGLEWLFRLSQEPLRLWRRYLVLAPMFLIRVLVEQFAVRGAETRSGH